MDSDDETLQHRREMNADRFWESSLEDNEDEGSQSFHSSNSSESDDEEHAYDGHGDGNIEGHRNEEPDAMDPKRWEPTEKHQFINIEMAKEWIEAWAARKGFKVRISRSKHDAESSSGKCMFTTLTARFTAFSVRCH